MRIRLLSTLLLLTIAQAAFGQLRGVVYSTGGAPIDNASVRLWASPKDSTIVAHTQSDARGRFTLPAQPVPRPIRITSLGHEPYTAMAKGDGDLDTIVLRAVNTAIGEVRISASHRTFTEQGLTIHNTEAAIRSALSGLDLITELNVPRVYVDNEQKQISLLGGGEPKVLINGTPATYGELRGLAPKWIRQIKYTSDPDAAHLEAPVVLDFIVERPILGGSVGLDLWNGLTTIYGEDALYAQLFSRRHSLELEYEAQFRNTNTRVVYNEEEYLLPDRTVSRREEPTPARFAYLNQGAKLRYKWFNERQTLILTASGRFDREWNNDYAGVGSVREAHQGRTREWQYRFAEHQEGRLTAPEASAYYSHDFGPAGEMQASAYGGYGQESATYERLESQESQLPFETSQTVSVRPMHAGGRLRYGIDIPLGESLSLSTSASATHQLLRQQTTDPQGSWSRSNSQEYTEGALRARLKLWGVRLSTSLGAHRSAYSLYPAAQYGFMPGIGLGYSPFRWWSISFDWYEPYRPPQPSQLHAQSYWLTPFLQVAGNPTLKASHMRQFTLNLEFFPHEKLDIFVQGKLARYFRIPFLHTSLAQKESGEYYLLQRFESLERTQRASLLLALNTGRLWDLLSLRLSGSMHHISAQHHSAFRHQGWYPQLYSDVSAAWRGLYLTHTLWYGTDFALRGDMVMDEGLSQRVELGARMPWMRVAVGVNNLLGSPKQNGERALSPLYRHETYREYTALNNMLYIKLSLHFNWGTDWNIPDGDEGETLKSGRLQFNR